MEALLAVRLGEQGSQGHMPLSRLVHKAESVLLEMSRRARPSCYGLNVSPQSPYIDALTSVHWNMTLLEIWTLKMVIKSQ